MTMLIIQANNIHESGAQYLLLTIFKSIGYLESDRPVIVFLDERFDTGLLNESVLGNRLTVKSVKPNIISRLWSEYLVSSLAKQHKHTTLLCMGNLPPLFPCDAKVVLYFQTVLYFSAFKKFLGGVRARIKLSVERLWIRLRINSVDLIVVQSPLVGDILCNEYSVDKRLVRIMPFADVENLMSTMPQIPASAKRGFLYPALGTPHKNHKTLIDAWVLLARRGLYPLLIVTIDTRFDTLLKYLERAQIESKIDVMNLGVIPHQQVLSRMTSSQAVIFPSLCESLGLPLVEARENAVPVIASERDYVREILNPVETFDPESALSIARAVQRFLGVDESPLALVKPEMLVDLIEGHNRRFTGS
jgi:glycosyltransferase involved in cell wall biosynthesis